MKRVVFDFNDIMYNKLKDLQKEINAETLGEALGYALNLTISLRKKKLEGFSKISVENPNTNEIQTASIV